MTTKVKRIQDREELLRQYGRSIRGEAIPQVAALRDEWRFLPYIRNLVERLRSECELSKEEREVIANGLLIWLEGMLNKNCLGIGREAHRPNASKTYFQAFEYLLRRKLGEPSSVAYSAVASRWGAPGRPLSINTVKRAVSLKRSYAEISVKDFVKGYRKLMWDEKPGVLDLDSAYRSAILMVDHQIDVNEYGVLLATAREARAAKGK